MRVVFFGTPAFAVPSLEALVDSPHVVAGVVTQPDKPRGRGHKVTPSPVKQAAAAHGIPVLQPDRLRDSAFLDELRRLSPDLGVVAAYGKILPGDVLTLPRLGLINVHASLLPRWRGAAPIHRAILAGDTVTGVTIMRVVQALDAGPMLRAVETAIGPNETSVSVEARLATMGADLLVKVIEDMERGHVAETPQDEAGVVYAARITRDESAIDLSKPAADVHNTIRGLQPWPLASALLDGRRVRFLESTLAPDEPSSSPPGTVIRIEPDALIVSTGRGAIALRRMQLDGRPVVSARDFLNGHDVRPGSRFLPLAHTP
jgi:methionyl-tRNA formyltransferase